MKKIILLSLLISLFAACTSNKEPVDDTVSTSTENYELFDDPNRFADLQILTYDLKELDQLNPKQKELVYYLSQAALSGREIIYAQNYKHNIQIKRCMEEIYRKYNGDRESDSWKYFEVYLKRIWFSNGIHHHYGEKKFIPAFSAAYLDTLIDACADANWPLIEGETASSMWEKLKPVILDPAIDAKNVAKDKGIDKISASANNYYGDNISEDEVIEYYQSMNLEGDTTPMEHGLNSRLIKKDGKLVELICKSGGLYGDAMDKMIYWLEKAKTVAENPKQAKHIEMLTEYFRTGDLKQWDKTNLQWVKSTEGDIDFILGFIEVYGDALGYKGAFEGVVQIKDFEASKRMQALSENAQWFEDQSPIMAEHKKENVVGVSYKVVNVATESGDAAPATPIGINLPNSNWIRAEHGSKSVSLGNIVQAYNKAGGHLSIEEFYHDTAAQNRQKKYGQLAGKMHTAMHEVIGHASGKINKGVGTPKETLKNYSNTLEEARADLVALYYVYDQKVVDMGLVPNLEVGMAEYESYITNGMFTQLRRLEPGENIEEDHMRNRQLVAQWCYEKGKNEKVIERKTINEKTYFVVNDYARLRDLFGQLLREIQRIKSEGDYDAAEHLVETYGVKADQALLEEARKRYAELNLAAYSGFVQVKLAPVYDETEKFADLKVEEEDFVSQMMRYAEEYAFVQPGE